MLSHTIIIAGFLNGARGKGAGAFALSDVLQRRLDNGMEVEENSIP